MICNLSQKQVEEAISVYERLKPTIEKKNFGEFIVIDPISKEYFKSPRLADATRNAKLRFPDRCFYQIKIGFKSALSFSP